jgi:hypothetical protein
VMIKLYLWMFGARWLPMRIRHWACWRGGRALMRRDVDR